MSITPSIYLDKLVASGNVLTIKSGASLSDIIDCKGASIVAIRAFTGFTSSNLTFLVASANAPMSLLALKDPNGSGNNLVLALSAVSHQPLDPSTFAGVKFLQVQCETPQASDALVEVVMGPLWQ